MLVPETLALLGRAAELRAAGTPWPDAALQLKVAPDDLRALVAAHRRDFDRLVRRAGRDLEDETRGATLAKLRELLKSPNEGVVMFAAGIFIRYELAKMRHEVQLGRTGRPEREPRPRNELPPPPSRTITAEKTACDRGCDNPTPTPEVQKSQSVASAAAPQKVSCDSVAKAGVTAGVTAPKAPATSPPPRGKTATVDAIRLKRWLPDGLAP
jgi:hypothetical protein